MCRDSSDPPCRSATGSQRPGQRHTVLKWTTSQQKHSRTYNDVWCLEECCIFVCLLSLPAADEWGHCPVSLVSTPPSSFPSSAHGENLWGSKKIACWNTDRLIKLDVAAEHECCCFLVSIVDFWTYSVGLSRSIENSALPYYQIGCGLTVKSNGNKILSRGKSVYGFRIGVDGAETVWSPWWTLLKMHINSWEWKWFKKKCLWTKPKMTWISQRKQLKNEKGKNKCAELLIKRTRVIKAAKMLKLSNSKLKWLKFLKEKT